MHKNIFRLPAIATALLSGLFASAQTAIADQKPEMADALRSSGKIYVVVTVLVIILCGLFLYLINLDRKVRRLEKMK